jgi:arsenate reductase-like glutaredoxin family protein
MDSFTGLNAQVLGISVDHVPCLKSWADSLGGIHYPLLSDFWPHGSVAERYGVLRTADGFSERAIFVIDKKGYIRYIDIHNIEDKPDNEEVRKALQQIEAAEKAATEATAPRSYAFSDLQEDEIPKGDIVLYCAKWCKDCRKAKTWLDERGLAYVEVDIDYNMAARNQVRRWANGFLVTPVIDIAGTIVLDFDIPKLEEALREKGR